MNPVWHFLNGVPVVPVIRVGTALAGDGTAAAPSYSFASDTNTGIRWFDADRFVFNNGGNNAALFSATEWRWHSVVSIGWSSGDPISASADVSLSRGAANRLDLASGDSFRAVLGTVDYANANGQLFSAVQQLTELTTIAAAATTDTAIQMPAGAVVLAVSVRVTTVIPTAATFTVGDSGSAARFSTAAVSTAATSTDAGTKAGAYYNASALSVRITPNLTPANNTGRVRVTIYYYTVTPPTS